MAKEDKITIKEVDTKMYVSIGLKLKDSNSIRKASSYIIDTGASHTIIHEVDLNNVSYKVAGQPIKAGGIGNGNISITPIKVDIFALGNIHLHQHIVYMTADKIQGSNIGILGNDILRLFNYVICNNVGDSYIYLRKREHLTSTDYKNQDHPPVICVEDNSGDKGTYLSNSKLAKLAESILPPSLLTEEDKVDAIINYINSLK